MIKFISLLSGGLDSPIAAYLMIRKGFEPIFLSFLTSDDEHESMKKKVLKIVQILKKYSTTRFKLYFVKHDPNLELFRVSCERKLTCILCKRFMIRVAKQIGIIENTNLIVTGDILGEQASQTLDNIYAYNDLLTDFLIIRPLIGWNKIDVIELNKEIGLYEVTSQASASCQFNPQYPETHAKINEVLDSESNIDFEKLIDNSVTNAERLEI